MTATVRPLIGLLSDRDDGIRLGATLALGQLEQEASTALPALSLLAQRDLNPQVRMSASFSIMRIQLDDERIMAAQLAMVMQEVTKVVTELEQRKLRAKALMQQVAMQRGAFLQATPQLPFEMLMTPQFQAPSRQLISLFLMLRTQKGIPTAVEGSLTRLINIHLTDFGPEAIPALVDGINLSARFRLGFC